MACDGAQGFHGESKPSENAYVSLIASSKLWQIRITWPFELLTVGPLVQNGNQWCEISPQASHIWRASPYSAITGNQSDAVSCFGGERADYLFARTYIPHLERLDICMAAGPKIFQQVGIDRLRTMDMVVPTRI